jgi:hypothetical protein
MYICIYVYIFYILSYNGDKISRIVSKNIKIDYVYFNVYCLKSNTR